MSDTKPKCKSSHIDPRDWIETKSTRYQNTLAFTCRHCGKFIGYRPIVQGAK